MKTYEYYARVLKDGHLSIPTEIKDKLKPDSSFRVLILIDEEDTEWNKLTASEFIEGYSEEDKIYDDL